VAVRVEERNVLGSIGRAVPEVEIQVRDPSTGAKLGVGEAGLVFTRGPNVMQGYHHDEALTREVIDENGWFNTGDLGFLTEEGDLCFRGRAKETIVLAGGENVEPSRVEAALLSSPCIEQVVVVGQDRKTLAALLLPDRVEVAKALHISGRPSQEELAANDDVRRLLHQEAVRTTAGLAPFERITRFALLPKALDVADGTLTQTLKIKRHVIHELYEALIDKAYGKR
jgi:long-chain acyl-CoA synthetase